MVMVITREHQLSIMFTLTLDIYRCKLPLLYYTVDLFFLWLNQHKPTCYCHVCVVVQHKIAGSVTIATASGSSYAIGP